MRPSLNIASPLLPGTALGLALLWCWGGTLAQLAERWSQEPQYSHGYLVPIVAAVMLWLRRGEFGRFAPAPVAGLGVLALACGLLVMGGRWHAETVEAVSLLPAIAGICLLIAGWKILRTAAPAIAFLVFMLPLPWRVEVAMAGPLQQMATAAGTYSLQTLGYPAVARGNTILLGDLTLGVAEACSGLRMLVVFVALATGVALFIRRPLWERLLVVASSIPIALACNVIRITATGMLYASVDGETARWLFHDVAGWLMMPLALAMLWLELELLGRLVVDVPQVDLPGKGLPVGAWQRTNFDGRDASESQSRRRQAVGSLGPNPLPKGEGTRRAESDDAVAVLQR